MAPGHSLYRGRTLRRGGSDEGGLQEGHYREVISGIASFGIGGSGYPLASQRDGGLPRWPCVGDHAGAGGGPSLIRYTHAYHQGGDDIPRENVVIAAATIPVAVFLCNGMDAPTP